MTLLHARHARDALLNYERTRLSSRLKLNVALWEISALSGIEAMISGAGFIIDFAKAVTIIFDVITEYRNVKSCENDDNE